MSNLTTYAPILSSENNTIILLSSWVAAGLLLCIILAILYFQVSTHRREMELLRLTQQFSVDQRTINLIENAASPAADSETIVDCQKAHKHCLHDPTATCVQNDDNRGNMKTSQKLTAIGSSDVEMTCSNPIASQDPHYYVNPSFDATID